MASGLICFSFVLVFACCAFSSPVSKDDFSCTNKDKCEELCGAGEGWCLGGWCACARKRAVDDVGTKCTIDSECTAWTCPSLYSQRCMWDRCLCIPELGR